MISALDISTSALVAQRVRLNAISGNIANMSSRYKMRMAKPNRIRLDFQYSKPMISWPKVALLESRWPKL